jgi:hypothetical protein
MPFLCRLIALLVFFGFSFELLVELFFEILDLTSLLEFEAENFPSDVAIYMHSNVEILFVPFVDFFLEKADAQNDEQRNDRGEYARHVVCLARRLAVDDLSTLIKTPKHLDVLILLSLSRIVEIVG